MQSNAPGDQEYKNQRPVDDVSPTNLTSDHANLLHTVIRWVYSILAIKQVG